MNGIGNIKYNIPDILEINVSIKEPLCLCFGIVESQLTVFSAQQNGTITKLSNFKSTKFAWETNPTSIITSTVKVKGLMYMSLKKNKLLSYSNNKVRLLDVSGTNIKNILNISNKYFNIERCCMYKKDKIIFGNSNGDVYIYDIIKKKLEKKISLFKNYIIESLLTSSSYSNNNNSINSLELITNSDDDDNKNDNSLCNNSDNFDNSDNSDNFDNSDNSDNNSSSLLFIGSKQKFCIYNLDTYKIVYEHDSTNKTKLHSNIRLLGNNNIKLYLSDGNILYEYDLKNKKISLLMTLENNNPILSGMYLNNWFLFHTKNQYGFFNLISKKIEIEKKLKGKIHQIKKIGNKIILLTSS